MPLQVAQSLIPGTTNTPLDARTVVSTLADILTIELPYVGMRVYCTATGKEYRITALKSKTIGALSVANAAVDTYQEIGEGTGGIQYLQVMVPMFSPNDATIHLVIEKYANSSWTTIVDTSTSAGAARCSVDYTFDAVTTSGFYGYQGGLTAFVSLAGLNLAPGDKLRIHWTPTDQNGDLEDSPYYPYIYAATPVGPLVEDLRQQVNNLTARIVALEAALESSSQF